MYLSFCLVVMCRLFVISVAMNSPGKAGSFGATGTHLGGGMFGNTPNNLAMKPESPTTMSMDHTPDDVSLSLSLYTMSSREEGFASLRRDRAGGMKFSGDARNPSAIHARHDLPRHQNVLKPEIMALLRCTNFAADKTLACYSLVAEGFIARWPELALR